MVIDLLNWLSNRAISASYIFLTMSAYFLIIQNKISIRRYSLSQSGQRNVRGRDEEALFVLVTGHLFTHKARCLTFSGSSEATKERIRTEEDERRHGLICNTITHFFFFLNLVYHPQPESSLLSLPLLSHAPCNPRWMPLLTPPNQLYWLQFVCAVDV